MYFASYAYCRRASDTLVSSLRCRCNELKTDYQWHVNKQCTRTVASVLRDRLRSLCPLPVTRWETTIDQTRWRGIDWLTRKCLPVMKSSSRMRAVLRKLRWHVCSVRRVTYIQRVLPSSSCPVCVAMSWDDEGDPSLDKSLYHRSWASPIANSSLTIRDRLVDSVIVCRWSLDVICRFISQ